ncbi:Plastocyanin [Haloplanus vescus]|uniref:Plastocyanin n=1 Tax=Haloplanus vescus TaxID=555874 RepID=A0A1H3WBD6_9EURY|nr:plastocyanin/azurin family copper-binding protein [Haloplanus vescus]SDZ83578.1 Plastocyanin [Haloplanus vescus]
MSRKPTRFVSRRQFAATFAGVVLAGCSSGGSGGESSDDGSSGDGSTATATGTPEPTSTSTATATPSPEADVTIEVGPDGNYLNFVPTRVRLSKGDTVEWVFKSSGHNVCCHPEHSSKAVLPDGAEPFGSHPSGNNEAVDPTGSRYTHTFETAGDYSYVCVLHAHNGMVGHLTVR